MRRHPRPRPALLAVAAALALALAAPAPADDAEPATPEPKGQVGSTFPEGLTLRTPEGASFDLSAAVREQPSIVIFYRGGW